MKRRNFLLSLPLFGFLANLKPKEDDVIFDRFQDMQTSFEGRLFVNGTYSLDELNKVVDQLGWEYEA